jgi:cytochrome c oxidase assembly factor CtaG
MSSNLQSLAGSWSPPLGITIVTVLTVAVYVRGWLRLRSSFPHLISLGRLIAFVVGVLAFWIAVGSPLASLDDDLLSAHMIQHLLLMAVAPPFLLLGAPVVPFLHGLPRPFVRRVLGQILRWRWVQWLGGVLSHPVLCLLAPSIALIGWHVPAAFELALKSEWWHVLEHGSFFITGIMLWWPVVQPWPSTGRWPRWAIPLYLFFASLPCDALSATLTFYDRVLYPSYLSADTVFRSALADQQFAGALMWVCVSFVYLIPAVIITVQLLSPSSSAPLQAERTPPPDAAGLELL